MLFKDRIDAGRKLADKLHSFASRRDLLVLGLPRGGVPVAFEVAKALEAPLDVFLVRKLGVPGQEELAMGALASGKVRILNEEVVESLNISEETINEVAVAEQKELERREQRYRGNLPPLNVQGLTILLIDDGLATGSTMRAAAVALRQQQPKEIIAAVPVSAPEVCQEFKVKVDKIICAETLRPFIAVGLWYESFPQTTDAEVRQLLKQAAAELPAVTNS